MEFVHKNIKVQFLFIEELKGSKIRRKILVF